MLFSINFKNCNNMFKYILIFTSYLNKPLYNIKFIIIKYLNN